MRLRRLEIERFRCVRELDWRNVGRTAVLVGPGDSGKSTILDAIERVLSPRWNVPFDDTDFWDLETDKPIVIRATITDLADSFYRDTKFGLQLHAYDAAQGIALKATGADDEAYALVVELRVEASLEPVWSVVDADGEPHPIQARDREVMGMLRVGAFVDQHLGWSRGSVLTRITESGDAVGAVLAEATRQARAGLKKDGLDKLTAAAAKVEGIARNIGVAPRGKLVPHLDAASLSVAAGAISLHDGNVPLRRAGLGTRRLLAVAMQREAAADAGLTIVDEFEHGLEPHRIRRLLRVLRGKPPEPDQKGGGQLIVTTHSPTVLSELSAEEVFVTRRGADGSVTVNSLPSSVGYVLARTPEALLARKVIVAEGATEEGLCLALDERWTTEVGISFAYRGVAVVDGLGGTQPAEVAGHLDALGYRVALLIVSDANAKPAKAGGAAVLTWPGRVCTEQRLAADLPTTAIRQMTMEAASTAKKGTRSVHDAIADRLGIPRKDLGEDPEAWVDATSEASFRAALGELAKQDGHAWFKSRDRGQFLGGLVAAHWGDLGGTGTHQVIEQLRSFAHDD
jgi:putative ATP-dependent endonuclease of OLD family